MDKELERFKACADAFGANPRRWPERDRPLFARLARTPAGEAILAAAQRTDAFLDAWVPVADTQPLTERIVAAAAPGAPARRGCMAWFAAGLAASALAGFLIGFAQVTPGSSPGPEFAAQLLVGPSAPGEIGL